MILLPTGLAGNDLNGCFQVFGTALDVGIARRTPGLAVVLVIHGPDVETVTGECVQRRIFALARHVEIVAAGCHRRTMHEEYDRLRRLARLRRTDALAEYPQGHIALLRPIFVAPDLAALSGSARGLRRQCGGESTCNEAKACAFHQSAASKRLNDGLVIGLRHDSSPKFLILEFCL